MVNEEDGQFKVVRPGGGVERGHEACVACIAREEDSEVLRLETDRSEELGRLVGGNGLVGVAGRREIASIGPTGVCPGRLVIEMLGFDSHDEVGVTAGAEQPSHQLQTCKVAGPEEELRMVSSDRLEQDWVKDLVEAARGSCERPKAGVVVRRQMGGNLMQQLGWDYGEHGRSLSSR